ncbi:hypothetical protein I5677_05295 [Mobilitalea sibirica]|uniref:Uncharacterized protein n=1 Tax=Mobilitalea sibirica TaxID=1462919 RepID=A0A8J7H8J7_9FIRM|nr:hypothetical protein [Mobilitalea sibirica]MBH1940310.1 hypothetical protein [Mobilitalea sibirica]
MINKKRLLLIATFLIIAAVAVVLCVSYFTGRSPNEFDGTLVNANNFIQRI